MATISTAPLYTSQHPGWNYEAMPYSKEEMPAPLPPRTDKLPWERKEAMEKELRAKNIAETQKAYDEARQQKARGGFINNMAAAVKPRWARIKSTPRPVREAIPTKRDERRFNNKFHFPAYERLLYASELCKTVSGSQQILGKVYISENFFCFRESRLQPKGGRRQRLLLVIPIDEILSIAQAEISTQNDPRYAPEFRVLDQWHSKADGIFLYTRDSMVHRFFGFWTQQTFHDTFNVLDRQWRERPAHSSTPLRRGEPNTSAAFRPNTANLVSTSRALPVQEQAPQFDRRSSSTASSSSGQFKQRTLPSKLLSDIRYATPMSRLHHVASPAPRYNHVLFASGNSIELVPLESTSTSTFSSQGRQEIASQAQRFRVGRYVPKRAVQEERDVENQREEPEYEGSDENENDDDDQWEQVKPRREGWQQWNSNEGAWHIMPAQLADDIKHVDRHNLHHVEQRDYAPAGINLGHVIDSKSATNQQRTGFMPRERVGFQTVQQRLRTQQRGKRINPQLKDEIGNFNLRSLNHVNTTIRQWMPQASDIKMRIPAGYAGADTESHKRHRHHKHHHKHARRTEESETRQVSEGLQQLQVQQQAPIQVFQYEEYTITGPKNFVRSQTNKLEEQLRQEKEREQLGADRWASSSANRRTYETGTA